MIRKKQQRKTKTVVQKQTNVASEAFLGSLFLANYCILENPAIGLNVSSSRVYIKSLRIVRPANVGVLITSSHNGLFDFGGSVISQSQGDCIRLSKRQTPSATAVRYFMQDYFLQIVCIYVVKK